MVGAYIFKSRRIYAQVTLMFQLMGESVRLNLFNHVLALFHAKFACILVSRYLVFR